MTQPLNDHVARLLAGRSEPVDGGTGCGCGSHGTAASAGPAHLGMPVMPARRNSADGQPPRGSDSAMSLTADGGAARPSRGNLRQFKHGEDGRRLLRVEKRNAETPIEKKPSWIKTRAHLGPEYQQLHGLVKNEGLHTVCQEAGCPNIFECWEDREATFLIGGAICTRRCDFCDIMSGKPEPLDMDEPRRVGESVARMDLRYATITGVTRDDLPDDGAWLYAETIRQIHEQNPGTGVEVLADDLSGVPERLQVVFDAKPEVFAHNLETVPRIFKRIRPAFRYERSLDVITQARAAGMITKSNLILGMGETREEISQALHDLYDAGTDIITITQYLRPSKLHHPIDRWVKPQEFVELKAEAEHIGFPGVLSGPLVRSSYRAGRLWAQTMRKRGRAIPHNLQHLADKADQPDAFRQAV